MTKIQELSSLYQYAGAIQQLKIDKGSSSVAIQHVDQTISLTMFSSLVSRIYDTTSIQDSIDYTSKKEQIKIEKSFEDLIKDLQADVSTMEDLLESIIGKIMVSVLAMILTTFLVGAAVFFFKPDLIFGDVFELTG